MVGYRIWVLLVFIYRLIHYYLLSHYITDMDNLQIEDVEREIETEKQLAEQEKKSEEEMKKEEGSSSSREGKEEEGKDSGVLEQLLPPVVEGKIGVE